MDELYAKKLFKQQNYIQTDNRKLESKSDEEQLRIQVSKLPEIIRQSNKPKLVNNKLDKKCKFNFVNFKSIRFKPLNRVKWIFHKDN